MRIRTLDVLLKVCKYIELSLLLKQKGLQSALTELDKKKLIAAHNLKAESIQCGPVDLTFYNYRERLRAEIKNDVLKADLLGSELDELQLKIRGNYMEQEKLMAVKTKEQAKLLMSLNEQEELNLEEFSTMRLLTKQKDLTS